MEYSFLNEDPRTELQWIGASATTALVVAGSGYRALLLFLHPWRKMTILDRDKEQIENTRRLFAQVSSMHYAEFVASLKPYDPDSPLYQGKHERRMQRLAGSLQSIRVPTIEDFENRPRGLSQREFFYTRVDQNRLMLRQMAYALALKVNSWRTIFGNRALPRINDKRGALKICRDQLNRLLDVAPIRENFFLQQLLYGCARTPEAISTLLNERTYQTIRENLLRSEICHVHASIQDHLALGVGTHYDFVSLSNLMSYLRKKEQINLLRNLSAHLSMGGRVGIRSFLQHLPEKMEIPLKDLTDDYQSSYSAELTQWYRFRVFEQNVENLTYDLNSRTYLPTPVIRAHVVHWSYRHPLGRIFNRILTTPSFSKLYGLWANLPFSTRAISKFSREFGISLKDYEKGPFASFNAFFQRRFLPGARVFSTQAEAFPAPCEGFYTYIGGEQKPTRPIWIKGVYVHLRELLGDDPEKFLVYVARLSPREYHRFHSPVTGTITSIKEIPGSLHSVNPVTLSYDPGVFLKNKRVIVEIDSGDRGIVRIIAVGATCVGSIQLFHSQGEEVKRGGELGMFGVGGSTLIISADARRWNVEKEISEQSVAGFETFVQLGTCIARSL